MKEVLKILADSNVRKVEEGNGCYIVSGIGYSVVNYDRLKAALHKHCDHEVASAIHGSLKDKMCELDINVEGKEARVEWLRFDGINDSNCRYANDDDVLQAFDLGKLESQLKWIIENMSPRAKRSS